MQSVRIRMSNIQSHENTEFTIEPGLNVIFAAGNNVGKSAIFKALRNVAESPANTKGLGTLLRAKCSEGYVSFEFGDTCIIYWLQRKTSGVVYGFFEIREANGEAIRTVKCPEDLLNALGIALDERGKVINFNDALAVQLLIADSVENDAIISRVLVDARVEDVKQGIISMAQCSSRDGEQLSREITYCQSVLAGLEYNSAVDSFREKEGQLETFASFLDKGVPSFASRHDDIQGDMNMLAAVYSVCKACVATSGKDTSSVPDLPVESLMSFCRIASAVGLTAAVTESMPVATAGIGISFMRILLSSIHAAQNLRTSARNLEHLERERQEITDKLASNCEVVDCPMRGKVYYSNEKCISCGL